MVVRRGDLVLFHRARSFGRDTHGAVREEGDTRLASQISRINPSDQWGDRCRSQIALTSSMYYDLKEVYIPLLKTSLFVHGADIDVMDTKLTFHC